jgi:hypothetical protein
MEYGPGTRVFHYKYGEGVISKTMTTAYEIFFLKGGKLQLTKDNEDLDFIEPVKSENTNTGIQLDELRTIIIDTLDHYGLNTAPVELGEKWMDGKLIMIPGKEGLQQKEIPIETFFHKIVMLRDRLRVLEQQINASQKLNDEDKVNLQQYITRCYGSLTTFNLLFKNKEDYFTGDKKE